MEATSAQEFLRDTVDDLLRQARHVSGSGLTYYYVAAGGAGYPAMYLRDFCYMVESAPEFMPADHVRDGVDLFFRNVTSDGLCPERFSLKGEVHPIYVCHGPLPALDCPMFLAKLVKAYLAGYEDAVVTPEEFGTLHRTLSRVPTDADTGLPWVDPAQPHTGYGFMDTIAITGCNLFCSLLLLEACGIMADLAERLGEARTVEHYRSRGRQVTDHLETFWDEAEGMYLAGTVGCRQVDIWGSVYACQIDVVAEDRRRRIAERLWQQRERCVYHGYLRHVFEPGYWERIILPDTENVWAGPGKFQNGAYWSTPTGWLAELWERWRPEAGRELLVELVREFQANGIWECQHPEGYRRLKDCLSSIVLPFQSAKKLFAIQR